MRYPSTALSQVGYLSARPLSRWWLCSYLTFVVVGILVSSCNLSSEKDQLLTDIPCTDESECGDGFRHGKVDYFTTCGQIDLRRHGLAESTLAHGDVAWSDESIEVREIVNWPPSEFVAVRFDGDICQDNPGLHWYIASATDSMDRAAFCGLVGGSMTPENECEEP